MKFCFGIHLDSIGAYNPPMGLGFDRRGNQGGGDVRGAVLNTTEQGAGGGVKDQTTHLPFCSTSISGIGKESKKRVQKGEKGYHESTTRYKRRY